MADGVESIHPGDVVHYQHDDGSLRTGKVHTSGKDGFTVKCDGETHRVKHENYVGHRERVPLRARAVEHGEDGLLAELDDGRRIFLKAPEDEESMSKAIEGRVFFFKAGIKGKPGLTLVEGTDKRGKKTARWKRQAKDESGAAKGYGTHNLERGDTVHYEHEGEQHTGRIKHADDQGAKVHSIAGADHEIGWHQVRGHMSETVKPALKPEVRAPQKPIAPDKFNAAAYAGSHDNQDVSADGILSQFPPEAREMIAQVQRRLQGIEQTITEFKQDNRFSDERKKIHKQIFDEYLSPAKLAAAQPAAGKKPTFTILGGRGGSGKSWFKKKVYDPNKAIALDADEIKSILPEYEGWNACQVHEESGEIFDAITKTAMDLGLNIVHDATMKTPKKAEALVKQFKDAGYRVEAHYMHLPRQEAAKRAVARFIGKTARYVPVEVILENTSNETSFDLIRPHVDSWSFRDNNVPEGKEPKLISQSGGDMVAKSYRPMLFFVAR